MIKILAFMSYYDNDPWPDLLCCELVSSLRLCMMVLVLDISNSFEIGLDDSWHVDLNSSKHEALKILDMMVVRARNKMPCTTHSNDTKYASETFNMFNLTVVWQLCPMGDWAPSSSTPTYKRKPLLSGPRPGTPCPVSPLKCPSRSLEWTALSHRYTTVLCQWNCFTP